MPLSDVGINGKVVRTTDRVKSTARPSRRRNFRTRRPLPAGRRHVREVCPYPLEGLRPPRAAIWSVYAATRDWMLVGDCAGTSQPNGNGPPIHN